MWKRPAPFHARDYFPNSIGLEARRAAAEAEAEEEREAQAAKANAAAAAAAAEDAEQ